MAPDTGDPQEHDPSSISFVDFPEDVQLSILSFLSPPDISSFSLTSKRFLPIARPNNSQLWYSLCHRRWSTKTRIHAWGNGKIPFHLLYKTLSRYEDLIGFWRHIGSATAGPPLVFFDWGPAYITGSRISPSKSNGYGVVKIPFIWMGLSSTGEPLNFIGSPGDFARAAELGFPDDPDLVSVSVSFLGNAHLVVEENSSLRRRDDGGIVEDGMARESSPSSSPSSSPPDYVMSEIYQFLANRTSPAGDRASRRQRKKDRARHGRRRWELEHYVKIVNCSPTPDRPLQGLWKGICNDMSLDFYLVTYDDIGGIVCRRVWDSSESFPLYSCSSVFWTSNTTFMESPFPCEEEEIYNNRIHVQPHATNFMCGSATSMENEAVARVMCINSSYDLLLRDLPSSTACPRHVEGRIWQYKNGTFGFGFLRNNFIIDLKHVALKGQLLDAVEHCFN